MSNANAASVMAYHERSKHRLERYAAGPETLDWDAQPDPFRRYAGAATVTLPLPADGDKTTWRDIFSPGAMPPRPAALASLGLLFELSFALSAWKELGPDRWALRCTPSSGNLHPTEVYLVARGLADLDDGLYHYGPKEHILERRAAFRAIEGSTRSPRLLVGLSSIHWRGAWKYGERAFRYCQLDIGHAAGALRYAAAVLGWRVRPVELEHAALAHLLGLDRDEDFGSAEREEPEALFELRHTATADIGLDPAGWMQGAAWSGHANTLDEKPMYRWPVIDQVALASRRPTLPLAARASAVTRELPAGEPARRLLPSTDVAAATLIRGRRSAQRFDRRARLEVQRFWPLLTALMPVYSEGQAAVPWDVCSAPAGVHALLFAHRIDGLDAGAYLLPRQPAALSALQATLPQHAWQRVAASPADVPLYALARNPALAGTLRTLSCHQAIGADAMFVVALLAEFRPRIEAAPWRYRELLREAGLIGQTLYLEAEAAGLRGTGIGCYFDDAVHELMGLDGSHWQVLYHFSVGLPMLDERITSAPPYSRERVSS